MPVPSKSSRAPQGTGPLTASAVVEQTYSYHHPSAVTILCLVGVTVDTALWALLAFGL